MKNLETHFYLVHPFIVDNRLKKRLNGSMEEEQSGLPREDRKAPWKEFAHYEIKSLHHQVAGARGAGNL
jgi:hypothetical protein